MVRFAAVVSFTIILAVGGKSALPPLGFPVDGPADQITDRPSSPPASAASASLRLNHLQVLGSHNSYKAAIDSSLMQILRQRDPETAQALDYAHPPLNKQLRFGLRSLELDVFYDPEGGRYADPYGIDLVEQQGRVPGPPYDPEDQMETPGFKVLHAQDLDFRSTCLTFQRCLQEVRTWSETHPQHLPLIITLNAKDGSRERPEFTDALPFDSAAFAALDREIRSVFGPEQLITPDDVRGSAPTLRAAVRNGQWPRLSAARGQVMLVLDQDGRKLDAYRTGHPSLRGRAMFANAPADSPEAAFHIINRPVEQDNRIRRLVKAGHMVRTRADAGTVEARTGDTKRREAAFASGAHVVTTDYFQPDLRMGTGYQVSLPGGEPGRCNPVSAPSGCKRHHIVRP